MSKGVKRKVKLAEASESKNCETATPSESAFELTALIIMTRGHGRRHGNKAVIVAEDTSEPITQLRLTADGEYTGSKCL